MNIPCFLSILLFATPFSIFSQTQIGQTLTEFAANDTFGASVAISDAGDRILTSAPRFNTNGVDLAGRADAYQFDGSNWVLMGATLDGVSTPLGLFGQGLDMSGSGNRIALGNNNAQPQVYEWNETLEDWEQMGNDLEFPGQPDSDFKTFRFTADENTLVIGATSSGSDSVYQFQWDGTNWTVVGNPLEVPVENELAISDNGQTVAVLFRESGSDNGIRIYTFNGSDWILQFTRTFTTAFSASDGFDLSADGTRLVLSYVSEGGSNPDGTFETYDLVNGVWTKTLSDLIIANMGNNNNALRLSADGSIFIFGAGIESTTAEASGAFIYQGVNNFWELKHHFEYENYDESILGNVDITPDGSKVVFGRNLIDTVGFVEVYDITNVLGTNTFETSEYQIYPNPTSGTFSIHAPRNAEISKLVVSDATGKLVQEITFGSGDVIGDFDFNISGDAGLYFVRLISGKETNTFKLLKK